MSRVLGVFAVAVAVMTFAAQADASPIRAAVSGSTTMGEAFPLSHMFDETGLSATYINGMTDFDSFVATTTHDSEPGNDWVSTTTSGTTTLDLGAAFSIDRIAVWNFGGLGGNTFFSTTAFTLLSSNNALFLTSTVLGTFHPSVFATLNPAQVFAFAPTTAQFFRLQSFSSNGAPSLGLGEIAFRTTPAVPEPATLLLFGTGLAAWAARRRPRV
jgi:hypothetical protein